MDIHQYTEMLAAIDEAPNEKKLKIYERIPPLTSDEMRHKLSGQKKKAREQQLS